MLFCVFPLLPRYPWIAGIHRIWIQRVFSAHEQLNGWANGWEYGCGHGFSRALPVQTRLIYSLSVMSHEYIHMIVSRAYLMIHIIDDVQIQLHNLLIHLWNIIIMWLSLGHIPTNRCIDLIDCVLFGFSQSLSPIYLWGGALTRKGPHMRLQCFNRSQCLFRYVGNYPLRQPCDDDIFQSIHKLFI